jgi:hypothetical protein
MINRFLVTSRHVREHRARPCLKNCWDCTGNPHGLELLPVPWIGAQIEVNIACSELVLQGRDEEALRLLYLWRQK